MDLNRQYSAPKRDLHPTVFAIRQLTAHLIRTGNPPILQLDFHGHSRKKDIFIYGNNNKNHRRERVFTRLLAENSEMFNIDECRYSVAKHAASTARVAMWRDFGIVNSFTIEASYCGASTGPRAGVHLHQDDLRRMGREAVGVLLECGDLGCF
eukprot:TRINITY_DN11384_c1_g2_i3.p3 TRINITY_DN11384_c1_g2~~TRINITY_DN11384_c1_g2_i3.p3  ORF type:complete len:153 (-),score=13.73 TRINITY_DN11384_c1_g2_i3:405-863(-)